jgi:hypothetical protein
MIELSKQDMLRVMNNCISQFKVELLLNPNDREAQDSLLKFEDIRQTLLGMEDDTKCFYGESHDIAGKVG